MWWLPVLVVAVLAFNFVVWKRSGRGWRTHVDALIAVLQPYVPEPIVDAVVLQPAGTVGRQARAEQGRGIRSMAGGMGGELQGALAEHRAQEEMDAEAMPVMTALAVTESRRHLLPVSLHRGVWTASPVSRSWGAGDARYALDERALTIQFTITVGPWTGKYEAARDPAAYAHGVLSRLAATG